MMSHELRTSKLLPATRPINSENFSKLRKLRDMWQFANLSQFLFMFGGPLKIVRDFDIADFESTCLDPHSKQKLIELGLSLLKFLLGRNLSSEDFDAFARRQYVAKDPERNPFGVDEQPLSFLDFNIWSQICILQRFSAWVFHYPDRVRDRMQHGEQEQLQWRIEPIGWDAEDHSYYCLDDNRLYRFAEPPPQTGKRKVSSRRNRALLSKRRKLSAPTSQTAADRSGCESTDADYSGHVNDSLGGAKWECVAVGVDEYRAFIGSIRNTKDANQKALHKHLQCEILPFVERAEENLQRKAQKQLKELQKLEKLTTAKRSSRIADKMEKRKGELEVEESEKRKETELMMARKEEGRLLKMGQAREDRMMTREQRIREREMKRVLYEDQLAKLDERDRQVRAGDSRISERNLGAELHRHRQKVEELKTDNDWVFDCSVCGLYGSNYDDGSHSIACDTCNVWQHSSCHGIGREEAEREDFHFVCAACKQHLANSSREHIPSIKIRLKPAQAFQTSHSIDEQPRLSPIRVESELHRLENVKEKVDLSKVAKLDSPAILQSVVVSSMTSEAYMPNTSSRALMEISNTANPISNNSSAAMILQDDYKHESNIIPSECMQSSQARLDQKRDGTTTSSPRTAASNGNVAEGQANGSTSINIVDQVIVQEL